MHFIGLYCVIIWLRRLPSSLPRNPGFDPRPVPLGYVVCRVALEQALPPEYFGSAPSVSFQHCSTLSFVDIRTLNKRFSSPSSFASTVCIHYTGNIARRW